MGRRAAQGAGAGGWTRWTAEDVRENRRGRLSAAQQRALLGRFRVQRAVVLLVFAGGFLALGWVGWRERMVALPLLAAGIQRVFGPSRGSTGAVWIAGKRLIPVQEVEVRRLHEGARVDAYCLPTGQLIAVEPQRARR